MQEKSSGELPTPHHQVPEGDGGMRGSAFTLLGERYIIELLETIEYTEHGAVYHHPRFNEVMEELEFNYTLTTDSDYRVEPPEDRLEGTGLTFGDPLVINPRTGQVMKQDEEGWWTCTGIFPYGDTFVPFHPKM